MKTVEKRAEELLVNNASLKKRQLELEEEVVVLLQVGEGKHYNDFFCFQIKNLKQEMEKKESALKSQITLLSERLQQVASAKSLL